jgi:hypothetical protein
MYLLFLVSFLFSSLASAKMTMEEFRTQGKKAAQVEQSASSDLSPTANVEGVTSTPETYEKTNWSDIFVGKPSTRVDLSFSQVSRVVLYSDLPKGFSLASSGYRSWKGSASYHITNMFTVGGSLYFGGFSTEMDFYTLTLGTVSTNTFGDLFAKAYPLGIDRYIYLGLGIQATTLDGYYRVGNAQFNMSGGGVTRMTEVGFDFPAWHYQDIVLVLTGNYSWNDISMRPTIPGIGEREVRIANMFNLGLALRH